MKKIEYPENSVNAIKLADKISSRDAALVPYEFIEKIQHPDTRTTVTNLFQFVKENIKYLREPQPIEMIRSPQRILKDREGSLVAIIIFAACILKKLNIPFTYRLVKIRPYMDYTHAYLVIHSAEEDLPLDFTQEQPFISYQGSIKERGIPAKR